MSQETPEQRIWKLEEGQRRTERLVERLVGLWEGNGQPGARDELRDIKREMRTLNNLTETMAALERSCVRAPEHKDLVGRVEILEDNQTKNEGFKLGRLQVVGIVSTVLLILGGIITVVVQLSNIASKVVTGGP